MAELGARLLAHQSRAVEALDRLFQNDTVGNADARLFAAMRYSLLAGGKRLRPVLVYAAADAVGGGSATAADMDRAACAIECIHTYSLIHVDLPAMDNDDLRRGVPTCHRAFDEATAILAGDALHTLAFELLAGATSISAELRIRLIAELARASGCHGMVAGQAMDIACVGTAIDQAMLEQMHALKTGALIVAALRMGALLGGATESALAATTEYGSAIGLAFQVQDDILDQVGSATHLGKQPGSDAAQAKPTYATLLGAEQARALADALCDRAVTALQPMGASAAPLQELARFMVSRDR